MSDQQQSTGSEQNRTLASIWLSALAWVGIGAVRMMIGFVAWFVVTMVALEILERVNPDIKVIGESPMWFFAIVSIFPGVVIASMVFLPLWKERITNSLHKRPDDWGSIRFVLPFAIAFQITVLVGGGFVLGLLNFVVAVFATFVVTLSLGVQSGRHFLLLLVAGSHGVSLCAVASFLAFNTPVDGWELKAASLLGAVPSIVLMAILFVRYARIDRNSSSVVVSSSDHSVQVSSWSDSNHGEQFSIDAPSASARADAGDIFYYVGPSNEPVGPISGTVLLQLRRSGVVSDDTFVAREGESDWEPLKACLRELELLVT